MSLRSPYQAYLYILLRRQYPTYRTPELSLADRGYPKVAIRPFRDTPNTTIYIIPKYSCRAKSAKGKALAVPRLIS